MILHNPDLYPDPETFKPERFLNEDGTFRDDPAISLAFGAGKRICPGRHLVDATLFIVTACVLSVFNVTKARDENSQDHSIPNTDGHQSSVLLPFVLLASLCFMFSATLTNSPLTEALIVPFRLSKIKLIITADKFTQQ